nr:protein adenylyltransferase SelO family protein [Planctomycetota bacterium]
ARHDPELVGLEDRALRFLEAVAERQARLVAAWLGVGFVHGVMNTDNSSISGETIDFGPCAFLDYYDPHASFSSIDRHGRYAYRQQGRIAQWNLARLAQCLVPLVDKDAERAVERATEVVQAFARRFEAAYLRCMLSKLGILEVRDGDADLLQDLLDALQREKADFTQSFRRITEVAASSEGAELPAYLNEWQKRYRARIAASPSSVTDRVARMRATNPVYIPRNHLVEEALAAAEAGDLAPFERLREVLQRPFEAQTGAERYASAGTEDQREYRTFCGT